MTDGRASRWASGNPSARLSRDAPVQIGSALEGFPRDRDAGFIKAPAAVHQRRQRRSSPLRIARTAPVARRSMRANVGATGEICLAMGLILIQALSGLAAPARLSRALFPHAEYL